MTVGLLQRGASAPGMPSGSVTRPVPASFADELAAEALAFESFSALLDTEHEALLAGDLEAVVRIAASKAERVVQLSGFAERRLAALRAAGFDANRKGMAEFLLIAAGPRATDLSASWKSLLEFAAHAQTLNDRNGAMIQARMAFNQAALAALRGTSRFADVAYGPDGTPRLSGVTGRDLGEA